MELHPLFFLTPYMSPAHFGFSRLMPHVYVDTCTCHFLKACALRIFLHVPSKKATCTCPHARGACVLKIQNEQETYMEAGKKRRCNSIVWFRSYWLMRLVFNLWVNLPYKMWKCKNFTLKLKQRWVFKNNSKDKSCSIYQNVPHYDI